MSNFSNPETILSELREIIDPSRVVVSGDDLQFYGRDWTRFYQPAPLAVVFPQDVEEVSQLVKLANRHVIGLVPSGGRTGLSGGAVALHGEIVVSFDRMNKIGNFDPVNRTVNCQAGVVTGQLQAFALSQELYYPVDFASAGSSQIGGNIATNAGGIKVIRYGLTRDWIAGLQVVTGNGDVLELNKGLVKNATGYDFRHLFIGSEGTLGFITEATIKLTRAPRNLKVLLLAVTTLDALMEVLACFKQRIDLTAYEFFSRNALRHVLQHHNLTPPFAEAPDDPSGGGSPYYALLEFEVPDAASEELVTAAFESCLEAEWVTDGVLSQSEAQLQSLWKYREYISESITPHTPYKNDISVTVSSVPEFLREVDELVKEKYPAFELVWFGHIGDGNLHLNILKPEAMSIDGFRRECELVNKRVFAIVEKYRGSISAEHGVGLLKKAYLSHSRDAAEIAYMKQVKNVFDPNNIMNPGKLI